MAGYRIGHTRKVTREAPKFLAEAGLPEAILSWDIQIHARIYKLVRKSEASCG